VVIAAHGNYDRPEWQCEVWREIIGARAFVLCPRGVARPDSPSHDDVGFTYPTNQVLEAEVTAALAALRAEYAPYVAEGRVVWTGFSLGAIMGVPIAARAPELFPRLVLIEGGHDKWTPTSAKAFARGGGSRVLFVCSQRGCTSDANAARARLEQAGVAARVVHSKDVGHRYDGPVAQATETALGWLFEGDARFEMSAK
jgi:pimeloyl-ACP methyl ester carboxylesterase